MAILAPTAATPMLRTSIGRACGHRAVLITSTGCQHAAPSASSSSPFSSLAERVLPKSLRISAIRPLVRTTPSPSTIVSFAVRAAAKRPASTASTASTSSSSTSSPAPTTTPISADAVHDARPAASAAAASAAATAPASAPLDWNTFFRLRKQRRRWQLGFSMALGFAGCTGGALFLSTGAAEWAVALVPLEPYVTLGLMTTGCALLGWLAGPSCGSLVFNALNRQRRAQMVFKEGQFFARIKKNRVDPTASSMSNPVPDYYGEKISSVAGYRQWLKDQRAFNKKRTTFLR